MADAQQGLTPSLPSACDKSCSVAANEFEITKKFGRYSRYESRLPSRPQARTLRLGIAHCYSVHSTALPIKVQLESPEKGQT